MITADQLIRLHQAPYPALCGRFHSHLTVRATDLSALGDWCRTRKLKLTVVDLDDFAERSQRDVMVTCYHRDEQPGAVARVAQELQAHSAALTQAGFPVLRVKLEHESLPSLPTYDRARYHEVHIKLAIPSERFQQERAWLAAQRDTIGWVPSRNPRERRQDAVLQFVNLRVYEGDRQAADERVDAILEVLEQRGLSVVQTRRETTLFDTNQQLDAWWT